MKCLAGCVRRARAWLTPARCHRLLSVWDGCNIGVLGLSSYLLLYLRGTADPGLKHVICWGAVGYILTLAVQAAVLRGCTGRLQAMRTTRTVFRLLYTALYLTALMIDIFALSGQPDTAGQMTWQGALCLWACIWGTRCLWLGRAVGAVRRRLQVKRSTNSPYIL